MSERDSTEAFVTLATNDTYSLGCLVLGASLRNVGTKKQLAVMVTTGVSNTMRTQLAQVFDYIQEVNVLDSKDPVNLALLGRPDLNVTFTKLHCWRLTNYKKAVFLDADTLVLQNVDELLDREELSAAPDAGWPDCFNSGVFVFKPSLDTYQSLLDFATSQGSFDGGDQGLLNMYFNKWATDDIAKHLPFVYNVVSQAFYSYLPAFTKFKDRVRIVHFIGAVKPWHHTYDTSTGKVTPLPGTGHSQEFLQVWWNTFMKKVQPNLDPSLKPTNMLLPTIVVTNPGSNRTYAYIPPSNKTVIVREAPWCWSTFLCPQKCSPFQFYKMACQAFTQCWQTKPLGGDNVSPVRVKVKAEQLTQSLVRPSVTKSEVFSTDISPFDSLGITNPASEVLVKIPFRPPDVGEIFYDAVDDHDNENDEELSLETSLLIEKSLLPRHYTELESHYTEPPISHIDPDAPPTATYNASEVTHAWEKAKKVHKGSPFTLSSSVDNTPPSPVDEGTVMIPDTTLSAAAMAASQSCQVYKEDNSEHNKDDEVGLAGQLASMALSSPEGSARQLSDQERKLNWEKGQIDYLGSDAFENIQKKIEASLKAETPAEVTPTPSPFEPTESKSPTTTILSISTESSVKK